MSLRGRLAEALRSDDPAESAARVRRYRIGWYLASLFLFYLGATVVEAARSSAPLAVRVVGVAAVVTFALGYFLLFYGRRVGDVLEFAPIVGARRWLVFVAMLALLVIAAPAAGVSVLAGAVYLAVVALVLFELRVAVALVALLVAAVYLLPRVVPGWTEIDDLVPTLLLVAFVSNAFFGQLVRNLELQNTRRRAAELAAVTERQRVGRDVHDILGNTLTVITIKAELAGRLVEIDTGRATREINDVERLARTALAEVRATVEGLNRPNLNGELDNAATALESAGIALTVDGSVDAVPEDRHELFAWTVREAITNVIRHSGARRCRVTLGSDRVSVCDDGHGMSPDSVGRAGGIGGTGLRGLSSRADRVGAALTVSPSSLGGVSVTTAVTST